MESGGITLSMVPKFIEDLWLDIIIWLDELIYAHPEGSIAG